MNSSESLNEAELAASINQKLTDILDKVGKAVVWTQGAEQIATGKGIGFRLLKEQVAIQKRCEKVIKLINDKKFDEAQSRIPEIEAMATSFAEQIRPG